MAKPRLERLPSMRERMEDTLRTHRNELVSLLSRYMERRKGILQPHELMDGLASVIAEGNNTEKLASGPFFDALQSAQVSSSNRLQFNQWQRCPYRFESFLIKLGSYHPDALQRIAIRPRPGVWEYVRVNVYELSVEQLTVSEYLKFKEQLVNGPYNDHYVLELDLEPFNASFPRPNQSASIGNGVQFLNRHLSSIMFRNKDCLEPLLDFLRAHKYKGHVMMVNDRIKSISQLKYSLVKAEEF